MCPKKWGLKKLFCVLAMVIKFTTQINENYRNNCNAKSINVIITYIIIIYLYKSNKRYYTLCCNKTNAHVNNSELEQSTLKQMSIRVISAMFNK